MKPIRFPDAIVILFAALGACTLCRGQANLPVVTVTADNTEIKRSCIIEIPPGTTIADSDGNGVVHIRASGIRVVFKEGSALWGGPRPEEVPHGPWDAYAGIGIRIQGAKGVTISGARIHGFKVGIWATDCDELQIEGADLSDNYRQRLKSTPLREDPADWLFPHRNEKDEWATQHGAGLYIRNSSWPTISKVRVRRGQNGILLHSVRNGLVYDNDCSFLSGWGLGMFRTSSCTITRNAFDFCVRGHSEGVYNRGQDSAGILMFEQCSDNLVIENSCTHSGDGIFGFAGLEALNGEGAPEGFDFNRKGCNINLFADNDLSYAPAHGLEMTFSFGNKIYNNRFTENAICGVWAGYSQDTLIMRNVFIGNGGMAYGLERGGVNIEHGAQNQIVGNEFINNRCGVHLWSDDHGEFAARTWGEANYVGVRGNVIVGNIFRIDPQQPFGRPHPDRPLVAVQVRDEGPEPLVTDTVYARNAVKIDPGIGVERLVPGGVTLLDEWDGEPLPMPAYTASGDSRPISARAHLRGRQNIIMGEWGPWDHETPMARLRSADADGHTYEVFGARGDIDVSSAMAVRDGRLPAIVASAEPNQHRDLPSIVRIVPASDRNGVFAYDFVAQTGLVELPIRGVIVSAVWQVTTFAWDENADPRTDLEAWRALAQRDTALSVMAPAIDFEYGHGGPKDQKWAGPLKEFAPGPDRFGMIARARLVLPAGKWRFSALSDDGVRVMVDGTPIIENWTWHGPTRDTGVLELSEEREAEIVVEHFEIDGYSVLKLDIAPER
jgi:nitrous oxidase accessory protein NosD